MSGPGATSKTLVVDPLQEYMKRWQAFKAAGPITRQTLDCLIPHTQILYKSSGQENSSPNSSNTSSPNHSDSGKALKVDDVQVHVNIPRNG